MTDTPPLTPVSAAQAAAQATTPYGRLIGLLVLLGIVFSTYASNLESFGAALSTPAAITISHFLAVAAGMAMDHFLVARPLTAQMRERLSKMETGFAASQILLEEMRQRDRENLREMGQKSAEIASLNTAVKYLQSEIDELRTEAANKTVKTKRKPPPKGDPQ